MIFSHSHTCAKPAHIKIRVEEPSIGLGGTKGVFDKEFTVFFGSFSVCD